MPTRHEQREIGLTFNQPHCETSIVGIVVGIYVALFLETALNGSYISVCTFLAKFDVANI